MSLSLLSFTLVTVSSFYYVFSLSFSVFCSLYDVPSLYSTSFSLSPYFIPVPMLINFILRPSLSPGFVLVSTFLLVIVRPLLYPCVLFSSL